MLLKKVFTGFFAVVIMCVVLAGCDKYSSVEKFTEEYYKAWINGEMTAEKSYDNYISQTSKDILSISKDNYVAQLNNTMSKMIYKKVEIRNVTDFNSTVYKVKCKFTIEVDGKEQEYTSNEYVVNENGQFKFLQYGVQAKQDVETSYSSNEFSMAIDALYTGPDAAVVNLIAKNPTTSAYAVGINGNAKIVVETDKGTFEATIAGTNIVQPVDSNEGIQSINGVRGDIKSISIYNIYELDASNQPKDMNNARSYTLYRVSEK